MAAILFLPFENRANIVGPDLFVRISNGRNKMAANLVAILVILNLTNIVEQTIRKPDHLITRHKKRPKNNHSNTGWSVFGGSL
jgi:hypothetical protein